MADVQQALASAAYALFALEQPIRLSQVQDGARTRSFPAAEPHTPEWFAAAVEGADLVTMAPELQVLPTDLEAAEQVDVTGIDLIHVYAPEMTQPAPTPAEEAAEEPAPATPPSVEKPRTSTQIGLLKELDDLDS